MRKTFHHLKFWVVTLRFTILSIFVTLFILTIIFIFEIAKYRFKEILLYTSFQLMEQESESVLKELTRVLNPISLESQFTANLIQTGVLNPENQQQMLDYTYHVVKISPYIQEARWADHLGNFIASQLDNNGSISSEIYNRSQIPNTHIVIQRDLKGKVINRKISKDLDYDPSTRLWYVDTLKNKKGIWTDLYQNERNPVLGLTAAVPIFNPNHEIRGVFGLDIKVPYLMQFIEHQTVSPHGFSFIVNERGLLIAIPSKLIKEKKILEGRSLPNIYSTIPWLGLSLDEYKKTKKNKFTMTINDDTYLFTYRPIHSLDQYHWLIGVAVPERDFTNELEKMHRITYLLCLIPLILGIILLAKLINKIVNPIKYLVRQTEKIKQFELENEIKIHSRIKEVLDLTDAITALQKGLRSFQKYVPKTLVKQLIETQEVSRVGGIRKPLVILFSDIKDFTAIAEHRDPNLLMLEMGEYFEALSKIIIECRGTIDKYIGDSIMAFWGAPLPENEPCHQAALAALTCQKTLTHLNPKWKKAGQPQFETRIGIHMGEAIIGNVGSTERLNYTAVGDAINMANRLESINKLYGTKIIVSDPVYHHIKNQFELRLIDQVILRGREKSNYIYELIAEHKSEIPYDIDAYRTQFSHGFTAYQDEKWDDAVSFFKKCMNIFKEDTVAPLFIRRVEHFKINPPKTGWQGIFKIHES